MGIGTALVTVEWEPALMRRLEERLGADEIVHARDSAEVSRVLERAEVAVIAGDLDERYVRAPRLRWVHCDHAGLITFKDRWGAKQYRVTYYSYPPTDGGSSAKHLLMKLVGRVSTSAPDSVLIALGRLLYPHAG